MPKNSLGFACGVIANCLIFVFNGLYFIRDAFFSGLKTDWESPDG